VLAGDSEGKILVRSEGVLVVMAALTTVAVEGSLVLCGVCDVDGDWDDSL
jgi:hypothetical protein